METRGIVGRDAELSSARAAIDRVLAGRGALVLIAGEPGIGKTTLADAFAASAEAAGADVAWGRCWEAGDAPPYWPWTQVFRAIGEVDPFAEVASAAGGEARDVRFRVFDRATQQLRARALEKPLVVVLDDLHAADVPSLLFLQLVARSLRAGARLGIVATYRDVEARLAGEVGTLLAKIAREGEALAPRRLDREEVARWVRGEQPEASDAAVLRVYEVSEGNPLFVRELLRVRRALDAASLPDGLRAILDEHVARVSREARALLEVASVLGREAEDADVAALAGASEDEATARLAEARAAGILSPASPRRHAFAHILLRDRVYAELAPSRRAELHRAAGARMEAAGDLASAAHHLLAGGDAARGPRVAHAAARKALLKLAFEEAERFASRAKELAPAGSEIACELEVVIAAARIRAGDTARGKDSAVHAAEMAKALGAPTLMAQAALAYGEELAPPMVDPVMVRLLRDALAALPENDRPLRARVMARLASALLPPDDEAAADEARRLADAAMALARSLGDQETMLFALRFTGAAIGFMVDARARLEIARETIELATRLGRTGVLIDRGSWYAGHLREHGLHAEAEATLDTYVRLVREFPQPHYRWRAPLALAVHATLDGDFDRADRLSREARLMIREGGQMAPTMLWASNRVSMAILRDEPGWLAPDLEDILPVFDQMARVAWWPDAMAGIALAAAGREADARARLRTARYERHNYIAMLMLGQVALLLRDPEIGEKVLAPLLEQRGTNPFFWTGHCASVFGPAARIAGEIVAMLGRPDEARALLEEAIALGERMRSPPLVAMARARIAALGAPARAASARPAPRATIEVTREGDVWRVRSSNGGCVVLKDAKGLHYLAELVREPGRELHVTQLADLLEPAGDAGAVLDAKAKEAYRRRLEDLRDALEEARRFGDAGRAEKAEREIDALVDQLAGAVGLGGRDRKMGSHVERARINVQRRLKDVVRRVEEQDAALGRWLGASLKTGVWCVFEPV